MIRGIRSDCISSEFDGQIAHKISCPDDSKLNTKKLRGKNSMRKIFVALLVGLLFIGASHNVLPKIASEIEVKCLD